jgi:integrase
MAADGSNFPINNPPSLSLADVIDRVGRDANIAPRTAGEMGSAIRKFCTVLRCDPATVEAHPRHLRGLFVKLTPAMASVGAGRWKNIKSLVLNALVTAGVKAMAGRSRVSHLPVWEALRARLPDRHWQSGLTRFMSYCTAENITPDSVTPATFEAFGAAVESESMRDPRCAYRDTCKLWNEAAETIASWPQVRAEVPVRRVDFSLGIENFPRSFATDLAEFQKQSSETDVFSDDYHAPVCPLTQRNRRQNVMMAAPALVRSGMPAEAITDLAVLVQIDNAKAALKVLYDRANGKTTGHIYQIATLLKTLARHYVRLDEQAVSALIDLASKLRPDAEGMSEKNRTCLRQFADERKLGNLLLLPERIFAEVVRRDGGLRRTAVRAAFALATAIEWELPLRADNLAKLRLDRHIHRTGDRVFLSFDAGETKNTNRIESELSAPLVAMLDVYLDQFHARLSDRRSLFLFPSPKGVKRPSGRLGQQLKVFLANEAGIVITPHQFRHLAAKLYLDRVPGDFETVRLLLGHKDIATTMRFYREMDPIVAMKRYSEFLTEKMEEARTTYPTPKRRGGKEQKPSRRPRR